MNLGQRFGAYRVDSLLGAGGMGEVYRAHDSRLGRDVALKVLPPFFTADPDRLARFEREARVLASLNHPNIAAIYGVEDTDGVRALVLELVEGETLADRIARGPVPVKDALAMARQIADALDAAHEKGIIHRDLKPANVKITPAGTVKVLDFGLAKAAEPADVGMGASAATVRLSGSHEGLIIGTAAYMSPEQARGQAIDKRTDIWAFGCVLFELLTGRSAFGKSTMTDTLAAVVEREPDWTALPPATPPAVRRLLERCLEKDAKRRLRDIGDARAETDDAGRSSTIDAPPRAVVAGTRRHPPAWIAVAAAVAGVGLVTWTLMGRQADGTGLRLSRAVRLTSSSAQEFGPAISPDGKWVAYYSNARGPTDVWVRFLDSGATVNLTASLNLELPARANIGGLAISPDGATVAFVARADPKQATFDTWVIPAPVGGAPRKLLAVYQGVQWSPDGRRLVCIRPGSSRGDALIVADGDGTNAREVLPPQGGRHVHWPVWSRDGQFIYFIYTFAGFHGEPSEIFRVEADGGTPEVVVSSARRAIYPAPLPDGGVVYAGNNGSVDLGLWWRPPGSGPARLLAPGVREYAELRLSADGRYLVASLSDIRQSLVLFPVSASVTQMRPMNAVETGDVEPSFDRTGQRMVFSSTRAGSRNLWIARADGSQARPLTSETALDERPAFSPDGTQIAFVSDRGERRGIWLVSAEGGAPRLLREAVALDSLTWSRDGTRILYATPGRDLPELVSLSVSDGSLAAFPTPGAAVAPAWSPTADVIAYLEQVTLPAQAPGSPSAATAWLTLVDARGQRLYPGLPKQSFTNGAVAWAPDGRRLAVVWNPASGASSIWIVEPDGRAPIAKLADLPPGARPRGITWTGDGSGIVTSLETSSSDIVLFELARE